MSAPLTDASLDQLFRTARTFNAWQDREVTDEQLRQVYDLAKMGPTAANSSPMRVCFIKSKDAKARLKPFLSENNVEKTMQAPATAIVATDFAFYEQLPKLFPHADARSWFVGNEPLIQAAGTRNGSLQGAYLILAARSLGLDCGPMSGFDQAGVDAEFFAGTQVKSNFLVNIGYGDPDKNLFGRLPRLDFDEAAQIL
ncbi:malonic semialdehyde reductase [Luteibacter yeojuensis]|uniref:Putative NADH dehydrogenase/NAD(P)H nitroreductase VI08_04905 n=1 Tax=Luteibacter yeojuensis TaxID=345309 RepID=A0A0F3KZ16_9GAMM|nr:malonic semialdehyde reductase [Luteibacter yeojuensis]KJV36463.1 nitroreductase [Luteibacter yeojuensis]